ncbi:MAG TPA: diguanylate cyclase, partial [Stellaceae bacterium]|nr:diguanylate cyclase [Stellaceae bacterium]
LPILLLFDDADSRSLTRGLELGADDYIARPIVPEELMLRVRLQLRRRLVRDRLKDSLTGMHRPLTDRLTGVYSKGFLAAHLAKVSLPDMPRQDFSALMLGVDDYPAMTQSQGQPATDMVLAELGRRLLSNVRPFDLVARYGDAVFVILMPQTNGNIALQIAERLRHSLTIAAETSGAELNVTISIGVAQREEPWRDPADLLHRAGLGLAVATGEGGNRVAAGPVN